MPLPFYCFAAETAHQFRAAVQPLLLSLEAALLPTMLLQGCKHISERFVELTGRQRTLQENGISSEYR